MLVSRWMATALAVALGAGAASGCGSDEPSESGPVEQGPMGEPLQVYFPKMYSAVIPGSDRRFQLPAIVQGVEADWKATPADAVRIEKGGIPNGVMITMLKPGNVKLEVTSGRRKGSADLVITEATEDQYQRGQQRYMNQIMLDFTSFVRMGAGGQNTMVSNNASCQNCHGSGATFLAVEHTPQQTGGYSDDEIKNIFMNGQKPEGAKYGTLPGIEMYYPRFHKWAASEEEYQGLVVYLRSLEPKTQGDLDFMGLINQFRMRMMQGQMPGATPPAMPADMGAAGSGM